MVGSTVLVGDGNGVSEGAGVLVGLSVGVTEAVSVRADSVAVGVTLLPGSVAVVVTSGRDVGVAVQAPSVRIHTRVSTSFCVI
jgi:hypothetical protein